MRMKTNKLISIGKVFVFAIIISGIIHDIATFKLASLIL
jgi:hypothetical protein